MENERNDEAAAQLRQDIARMEIAINRERAELNSAARKRGRGTSTGYQDRVSKRTATRDFRPTSARRLAPTGQPYGHNSTRSGWPSSPGYGRGSVINHHSPPLKSAFPTPTTPSKAYEVNIDGIRFAVAEGGSRLNRVTHQVNNPAETPKTATVAGVLFLRAKDGNLSRATAEELTKIKMREEHGNQLCPRFTSRGSCRYGSDCYYIHDPEQVAVCPAYLMKGRCPHGDSCDLSHQLTAARVVPCSYYQRDACTNAACRFPHVKINAEAPVCDAFARLGYCASAESCHNRHAHECPAFSNKGQCPDAHCKLPHTIRAGALRGRSGRQSRGELSDESDVSSVDVKSLPHDGQHDGAQEAESSLRASQAFSQQDDFVRI